MRKIAYILITVLTLSACNNFLDVDPQGQLTQDSFYEDEKGAVMGINAIYSYMKEWSQIGFNWFAITELPSDNSDSGSELSDGSVARLNLFNDFRYDAGAGELNDWWTGNYKAIASCNMAIDNLPKLKNEALRIKLIAQARFFRGYFYFNMVRTFGGVPLVLSVPAPGEYNKPRATEEEVYAEIIRDMTYAAEHLPTRGEWGTKELGRVTKGTAEGMLAKVYLFRQDYVNAKKYAGQVITGGEYDLHPDYRDLFNPKSVYSMESMMSDQYLWTEDRNKDSEFVKWQGVRGHFGWGYLSPSKDLADSYEASDPRREATIFFDREYLDGRGVVEFPAGVEPRANKKTIWPTSYWNQNSFEKTNAHLYFLRYADVLLMYAEACNEVGDTDEALTKLEWVRERARRSATGVSVLPEIRERDRNRLREMIWEERRIELALEGHRFFDLIRADKVVPGYAERILRDRNGKSSFSAARHARFLIPQNQIDISGGILTQN